MSVCHLPSRFANINESSWTKRKPHPLRAGLTYTRRREPMRGWPRLEPWSHRKRNVGFRIVCRSLSLPLRMQVIACDHAFGSQILTSTNSRISNPTLYGRGYLYAETRGAVACFRKLLPNPPNQFRTDKSPTHKGEALCLRRREDLNLRRVTPYLISSEAHSTGLCDVSYVGTLKNKVPTMFAP